MISYYIKDDGRLYGPVKRDRMISAYRNGLFSSDAVVSYDQLNWVALRDFSDNSKTETLVRPTSGNRMKPEQHQTTSEEKTKKKSSGWIYPLFLFCLLCCGIALGYWWFYIHKDLEDDSVQKMEQTLRRHASALGSVVVSITGTNGVPFSVVSGLETTSDYVVGTAFAIEPDLFVTNCSKIYPFYNMDAATLENITLELIKDAAAKSGAVSIEQFRRFCHENSANINKLRVALSKGIRIDGIKIKIAGGETLNVKTIQMHPRYRSYKEQNADVALLTVENRLPGAIYFRAASRDDLSRLVPGMAVGCPEKTADKNGADIKIQKGYIDNIAAGTGVAGLFDITCNIPAKNERHGSPLCLADGKVIAIVVPNDIFCATLKSVSTVLIDEVKAAVKHSAVFKNAVVLKKNQKMR